MQRQQRPVGVLDDLVLGLEMAAQMGDVLVPAAGVDDDEKAVAGVADDQVVEDAAAFVGEDRVASLAELQPLDVAGHEALDGRRRLGSAERDLAHVRHVEEGRRGPALLVLGDDPARILDRHLPAGEGHHAGAQLTVKLEQGRTLELAQQSGLQAVVTARHRTIQPPLSAT